MPLHIINHPLAGHILAQLRDQATRHENFRKHAHNLTTLLAIEATRSMQTTPATVQTPVCEAPVKLLDEKLAVVPILRAGLGMLEAVVQLFPEVYVGYVGLERDEETAIARAYYNKMPELKGKFALCVDPMLATGGSAVQALSIMKEEGAEQIKMVCIVAAPEGVAAVEEAHPDIEIYTASLDEKLNDKAYIVPGLGDFGDRLYGT